MALISFFTAKKSGMKDSQAALVGAAAGFGSYYVATETEWGKSGTAWLRDKWTTLTGGDGTPLLNADGTPASAPPGAVAEVDATGKPVRDANGNILWKLLDETGNVVATTGDVLKSWGGVGTAAVIGTTAVARDDSLRKWLPVLGIGLVFILLAR